MKTILKSALIITMDKDKRILNKSSLVIEDGKIIDIGEDDYIMNRYPDASVQCCRGKVLMPGFINTHTHQTLSIIRGVAEDMGTAPAYTKSVPQGYQLSDNDSFVLALLGATEALKFGSTTIVDMYTNSGSNAKAFSLLGMRANVCEMVHDMDFSTLYKRDYRIDNKTGQKLFEKNIALIEKWKGNKLITPVVGLHAPDTCSEKMTASLLDLAEKEKSKVITHLAQSKGEIERVKAVSGGLSSVEYYERQGVLSDSLIAAHCIYVDENDIEILKKHKVNISHIPEGNAKGGMAAPLKAFIDHGCSVTIGTDNGSADMIDAMRICLCVSRVIEKGFSVMPYQMLEMATINGARAIGREKDLGSLEIGKQADILVMNMKKAHLVPCLKPVGTIIHNSLGSDIETVYVAGKKVVDNYKVIKVNEADVIKEAQKIATDKWLSVNNEIDKSIFINL